MDSDERVHLLDPETLALFAAKGSQARADGPRAKVSRFNPNVVKVRRVMQLTRDWARRPFSDLRILDLACGEGVFAIEAGLRGAKVLAVDGRPERMNLGAAAAARLGLANVTFQQQDVRTLTKEEFGTFDVIFCLGLLYHLDTPDSFHLIERLFEMSGGLVIVDTQYAQQARSLVRYRDQDYGGLRVREHADDATPEARRAALLMSLDNTWSFFFTRQSLMRLLDAVGFSSILECHTPWEPGKAGGRVTLLAQKGARVKVSAYPWVNDAGEDRLAEMMALDMAENPTARPRRSPRRALAALVKSALRRAGYELRRL